MYSEEFSLSRVFRDHVPLTATQCSQLDALVLPQRNIEARRKLVHDGSECNDIFIVTAGWLAAFKQLHDGGRQIFNFWLPGDFAGLEFLTYRRAPYAVMGLTSASVIMLSKEALAEMKRTFPWLEVLMLRLMARNSVILRQRMVSLGRRTAFSRVAHLLLELRLRVGQHGNEGTMPFPLTQLEIADCIGLTAPYVNRILRLMRERELLYIEGETLRICDAQRLASLAEFHPDYLRLPQLESWMDGDGIPAPMPAGLPDEIRREPS